MCFFSCKPIATEGINGIAGVGVLISKTSVLQKNCILNPIHSINIINAKFVCMDVWLFVPLR